MLDDDYFVKIEQVLPEYISNNIECSELYKRMLIGLLTQINLQLSKMNQLLEIATGVDVDEQNIGEDAQYNGISTDNSSLDTSASVMCGACGKGVLPNRMGYCPKCGNDLRKQYSREKL